MKVYSHEIPFITPIFPSCILMSTFVRSKEEKEENDDEEELQSKRRMDEYKDEHKRGEGNRHNMG